MKLLAIIAHIFTLLGFNNAIPAIRPQPQEPHGSSSPHVPRQQVCNGNAAYCDRIYSNVTWIGTHDSAFVGSLVDPRVNQEVDLKGQLDAGIRFLQAQVHALDNGTELAMCHTSCVELNAGPLEDYLTTVKTWLDDNPDEVVSMLLVNGDFVDPKLFGDVFESTGLSSYAFVPSSNPLAIDAWPTYGEMIADASRLVVFMDYDANVDSVPYILPEFTYFFETPYDTTDPSFPQCDLDRPANGSPDGRMYLVNHYLDQSLLGILIPDNQADSTTNAATGDGSLGAQAELCTGKWGREPNVLLVDMFDRGEVFGAQDAVNGVA